MLMCLEHRDCSETQREKFETMTQSANMISAGNVEKNCDYMKDEMPIIEKL
jgi:hypothetical protein